MNKNDKRFLKTEQLIKKSFVDLCRKKDRLKITITDICNEANINRCTFYLHYESIEELISNVEKEYAQKLIDCSQYYHYDKITDEFIDQLFLMIEKNKEVVHYWLFLSDGKMDEIVINYLKEKTIPVWMRNSSLDTYEADLAFEFILNGGASILKKWFLNNFKEKDKTMKIFEKLIKHGLYSMIYK